MMQSKRESEVSAIRGFNRYYTNVLGLLNQKFLDSEYSLSEVRVLHEINKMEKCTSKYLVDTLSMDSGYLSHMLTSFQKSGLLQKKKSDEDGRAYDLSLTSEGRKVMTILNARSDEQINVMLKHLSDRERTQLVKDMTSVECILTGGKNIRLEDIKIRHSIKPGDAGFIIGMHGWIYKEEYGYTTAFEAYVANSFYEFLLKYDSGHDRLWIAEHYGNIIGCIGVVGRGENVQIRWFLLHPNYRGLGLGKKMLKDALDFCRDVGYKTAYLDTTSDLEKAISMYQRMGFVKISEKENHTWKDDLTELEFAMKL